jgi:hypothetical protein
MVSGFRELTPTPILPPVFRFGKTEKFSLALVLRIVKLLPRINLGSDFISGRPFGLASVTAHPAATWRSRRDPPGDN